MNWNIVVAICEIIGAVAIVASLLYVSKQIRQNAKSLQRQEDIARSQILQSRADSINSLAMLWSTPENLKLITKLKTTDDIGPKDLSPEENVHAFIVLTPLRSNLENTYLQYTKGFLPNDFYADVSERQNQEWGPLLIKFNLPLTKEFRAELERIIADSN